MDRNKLFKQVAAALLGLGILSAVVIAVAASQVVPVRAFYIAQDGADGNPGTLVKPFRTIEKCARTADAGDTCFIRAGTYRETVKPTQSGTADAPLVFQAYNGERATVNGADEVTHWSVYQGKIYRAQIDWDLGEGKNQVFVDGQMLNEARFPNTTLDVSHPAPGHAQEGGTSGNVGVLQDSLLSQPINYWQGARIWFAPTPTWIAQTSTILSSASGSVTFQFDPADTFSIAAGVPYYLTGTLKALDSPGEWFLDANTHTLYLWLPNGEAPAGHQIEVKRRAVAFDLSGRAYVHVEGLHLFGTTIISDDTSQHLTLDHLDARYLSHFSVIGTAMWSTHSQDAGIVLRGHDSVLQNSTLAYSAGNAVTLAGTHHAVFNNVIHDVNYTGTDTGAINTGDSAAPSTRHVISYNTLYNSGRGLILNRNLTAGQILHNDLFNFGLQMTDLGGTYTYGEDGMGTEIAYNLVHDSLATGPTGGVGIYLDGGSSNFLVHHNVVWNVSYAMTLNRPTINNKIYNNTLLGSVEAIASGHGVSMTGTSVINNILVGHTEFTWEVEQANNLQETNPQFKDWTGNDFQLQSASPAIDAGQLKLPGTDGFQGKAPDLGAYEWGVPPWRAGSTLAQGIIPTPVLLDASSNENTVVLRWGKVANATRYRIHYGTSANNLNLTAEAGDVTDYTVSKLPGGVRFFFAVTAYAEQRETSMSNLVPVVVRGVTLKPPLPAPTRQATPTVQK